LSSRWSVANSLWLGVGLGIVLALVGLGARYDAPAAAWPLLVLPFLRAPSAKSSVRRYGLIRALVLGLVLTLGLSVGLNRALRPISATEEFWQLIPMFDLVGMSVAAKRVLISPDVAQFSQGMNVEELKVRYNPEYHLGVLYCQPYRNHGCAPAFRTSLDRDELNHLVHNWLRAIVKHPVAYLQHRTRVARHLLGISPETGKLGKLYYVSVAPHHPLGAEYPPHKRSVVIMSWLDEHVSGRLVSPLVVCLAGLPAIATGYREVPARPLTPGSFGFARGWGTYCA
jgi:hypothetical protein